YRGSVHLVINADGATMTALPNTRDALETSWNSAGRHARRIARHGRNAAEDIGGEMRELLSELENALGDGTQADAGVLREQLKKRIDAARAQLDGASETLRSRAASAVSGADDYVREKPWQTVAVVGTVALFIGWLLASNR
ncbi:MAG: hypothetical protein QOH33_910, partial [Paraburkholderia sp.]|nr:hypothetical protein [Paraburkholderia sp.]